MQMEWLWGALALVCVIEGLGPLLFPERWRLYLLRISEHSSNQLRQVGGVFVVIGLVTLYYLSSH